MKTIHINKKAIVPLLVSTIALSGCDPRHWPTDVSAECDVSEEHVDYVASGNYTGDCTQETIEENLPQARAMNLFLLALLAALASNNDSTTTSGGGGGYTPPS